MTDIKKLFLYIKQKIFNEVMKKLVNYINESRQRKPSLSMLNDFIYHVSPYLVGNDGSVLNGTYKSYVVFAIGSIDYDKECEEYILGPHSIYISENAPIIVRNYEKLIKDNNTIKQMDDMKKKYEEDYRYIGMDYGFALKYDDFTDLGKELIQIIIRNLKYYSYLDGYMADYYDLKKKDRIRLDEIINM